MIALLSDIHSNIEALTNCLAEVEGLGADRLICLGDVIGYGPQPRDALRTIMDRCEFSTRAQSGMRLILEKISTKHNEDTEPSGRSVELS